MVIGDEGAGKTSLITSAATESFPDHPPPVLPHTRLPPEATPENVPVIVLDTSSRVEERTSLEMACQSADVALLVFASDSQAALERVGSYWMEELNRMGVTVPVILVGTKSDLKKPDWDLQQAVKDVMRSYKGIEACLECSAKNLVFVSEVFYYAIRAVFHPTAPLFDPSTQTLKPRCVSALKRIFMLCDVDRDDALDDTELNSFQVRCFNAPLQAEEITGVKKVVRDKMPHGVNAKGFTLPGFLFLNALFIERGRMETTWAVLRQFGYNDQLRISDTILDEMPCIRTPEQVVGLTEDSIYFLRSHFRRFHPDGLGALSHSQLDDIFSTAPYNLWEDEQYDNLLVQSSSDGLTEQGWLAKWGFTAASDPRAALEWLMYLGYTKPAATAFAVSRPRRQERKAAVGGATSSPSPPSRSVLQGLVFGGSNVGKTALLARLAGQPGSFRAASAPSGSYQAAGYVSSDGRNEASEVQFHNSQSVSQSHKQIHGPDANGSIQSLLLLREVSEATAADLLRDPIAAEKILVAADVAIFVFDCCSLSSWETAHRLMLAVAQAAADGLPCVLIASKDDMDMPDDVSSHCRSAVAELKLPMPSSLALHSSDCDLRATWQLILEAAQLNPGAHIPHTPSLRAAQQRQKLLRRVFLYGAAVCAVGICSYGGWTWWYRDSNTSSTSSSTSTSRPDATQFPDAINK